MTLELKRIVTFLLFCLIEFFVSTKCYSQSDAEIADVKDLPIAKNWATLKGYNYSKILYMGKDSLKRDLNIELWDSTYKIKFFRFSYLCEDCDIWIKTIVGNAIKIMDCKILNKLKNGEVLEFVTFKIEKSGNYYTLPSFAVFVTD
jgi:hypothetical protein